jgi:hypothetical protein
MTREQRKAIAAHKAAHDAKQKRKTKARLARYERNKLRGLHAAIARMMESL